MARPTCDRNRQIFWSGEGAASWDNSRSKAERAGRRETCLVISQVENHPGLRRQSGATTALSSGREQK